jgi:hypothetical protein
MRHVGMNLAQGYEWHLRRASGAQQLGAISHDSFACIPFGEAEVQDALAFEAAIAALARAETVDQPRNLR